MGDRLWPEVDKDKSGTVSMDELFAFMRAKKEEKAHERWESMDKDGDSELTKQEVKNGQDKFSDDKVDDMWPLIDKDKSDTISFDEFVAFMKAKKKEANGRWNKMDKDGDGEGLAALDDKGAKKKGVVGRWKKMDKDGDGELTKQEAKDGQDKFSDDKVDAMWPLIDKDKNG